tara:strand:- start:342 stop:506 length:165 start_codon:yes stop_codon:yes gene_type:complete
MESIVEDLDYYKKCYEEFVEALESERLMEEINDSMIQLLVYEVSLCLKKIEELS